MTEIWSPDVDTIEEVEVERYRERERERIRCTFACNFFSEMKLTWRKYAINRWKEQKNREFLNFFGPISEFFDVIYGKPA